MTYLVTARKWRPMVFEDVVGQSHVTATLRNAIASNRLAHSYLFSGPRGTGKTTMARLLAKAVNCRQPRNLNPCNECDICEEITQGRAIDVFEIDGASNRGIDEIRDLREAVRYGPSKCKYKVYIIDEVHMLTTQAFNALLKTLEEPPSYILFIFATTEVQKVPLTILSRCHRFDFRRITIDEIIGRLRFIAQQEKISIDDDSLFLIAKKGDGSLRDAQSIFDQVVAFCGNNITASQIVDVLRLVDEELFFAVTDLIKSKNTKGGLELVEDIIRRGYDIRDFLTGLLEHFRNFLIVRSTGSTVLVEASEAVRKRYQEEASLWTENDLLRLMKIVTETENAVKWSTQPRIRFEAGILQMIKLDSTVEIKELLDKLEDLNQRMNSGSGFSSSLPNSSPVAKKQTNEVPPLRETTSNEISVPISNPATFQASEPQVSYTTKSNADDACGMTAKRSSDQLISLEEIQSRWKEFVEEIRRQRIYVGTLLSEFEPPAEPGRDGTVKLSCSNQHQLSLLKKNKNFLAETAQKIYGKRIRFEISLAEPRIEAEAGAANRSSLDHPIIQALMRELGAEPIQ